MVTPALNALQGRIAELEVRLLEVTEQRNRAREALFECAKVSGADISDGAPTSPPLEEWAVDEVKQLRDDADDETDLERAERAEAALREYAGFDDWPTLPRVEHGVRNGTFGTITVDGERAYGGKWNPHLQRLLDGVTYASLALVAIRELNNRARAVLGDPPTTGKNEAQ